MNSFDELRERVDDAREEYQLALATQREVFNQYTTGSPHPDGTQHLHQVNETLRTAFERYTQALTELTDYVLKRM